jgi:hypothetical protein
LIPSSLNRDVKRLKEELSWHGQTYSYVFYLSLECRSPYYKEGCNMVILTKPNFSKPREIWSMMKGNQILRVCWNLSYRSDRYCTPVRPVGPVSEQVRSTGLVRSLYRIPKTFSGHVRYWTIHIRWTIWLLEFELHQTCPAPLRICQAPNPNLSSERVFISEWPKPIWSHPTSLIGMVDRSALTTPTASFPNSYKGHSTPSLVGCWFLTVWITFQ